MNHPKHFDSHLRRDLLKLIWVFLVLGAGAILFVANPALSSPTFLSVVITFLLSPLVAALERKGYPRILCITIIGLLIGGSLAFAAIDLYGSVYSEWDSFRTQAPAYFDATVERLKTHEALLHEKYEFLQDFRPTESLTKWGDQTGSWFMTHAPELVGNLLSWFFLVPIITFFLLNEGPSIRKRFFQLIPNRFFESSFMVISKITTSLADYLRAKLVEASLVGIMTAVGLAIVGAPYVVVLSLVAAVTNFIPYLGPILGAVPGIAIAFLDPQYRDILWPVVIVYGIANIIDMVFIFPIVVAKLVNLHPLILIAVVIVGEQLYGLVGMLVSIPVATAIKVVTTEIYRTIYEQKRRVYGAPQKKALTLSLIDTE